MKLLRALQFRDLLNARRREDETAEERSGAYTIETADDLGDVIDFYVTELEKKGFAIENRFTSSDGGMVTAKSSDGALTVNLAASVDGGTVEAIVNFVEK